MHSSRARAPLWLIGRESNSDSVSPGCAGGSTTSTSAWASRRVKLGFVVEINEHVEPFGLRLFGQAICFASRGRCAALWCRYLYELELDLAFLNKVVLFA